MTQEEKAKEYSFNIESQLFPTLNAEQQKLWKQEIEQAYMAGAEGNTQDQIDALRMEYEKGRADTIDKVCEFLKDRILHDSIDYPMATLHLIDDLKNYMEELQ